MTRESRAVPRIRGDSPRDNSGRANRAVTITGFKAEADARRWLIAEATHTLDSNGLTTKIKLETQTSQG